LSPSPPRRSSHLPSAAEPVDSEPTGASHATAEEPSSRLQPEADTQPDTAQTLNSDEPTEAELIAELEAALREHPETDSADEELAQDYQDFSLDSLLEEDEELKQALGD